MPNALDLLTEWLAGELESYTRVAFIHRPPGRQRWSCVAEERFMSGKDDASAAVISIATHRGSGPIPDAAIRAAVEKANKERI